MCRRRRADRVVRFSRRVGGRVAHRHEQHGGDERRRGRRSAPVRPQFHRRREPVVHDDAGGARRPLHVPSFDRHVRHPADVAQLGHGRRSPAGAGRRPNGVLLLREAQRERHAPGSPGHRRVAPPDDRAQAGENDHPAAVAAGLPRHHPADVLRPLQRPQPRPHVARPDGAEYPRELRYAERAEICKDDPPRAQAGQFPAVHDPARECAC